MKRYYAITSVKGGPKRALAVWHGVPTDPDTGADLDRAPRWQATLDGQPVEDLDRVAINYDHYNPALGITINGKEIDQQEHDYIVKLRAWAVTYAPGLPEAKPRQKIDVSKMPPIAFNG